MDIKTLKAKAKTAITLGPLKGYRTYIAAVLIVILAGLKAQGYIDDATFQITETVLASVGLITLRAGVGK